MWRYVQSSDVASYIGAPDDATLATLIASAESVFDGMIGSENGLDTTTITEDYPVKNEADNGRIFYLRSLHPTAVTSVNGVTAGVLDTDYTLLGQKLEFDTARTQPTAFPYRFRIVYTAGYTTIPDDIKLAIMEMCGALNTLRKSQGIQEFKQDLLTIKYTPTSALDAMSADEKSHFTRTVNRYKIFSVI